MARPDGPPIGLHLATTSKQVGRAFNRRLRRGLAEHDIAQLRELLDRLAANVG